MFKNGILTLVLATLIIFGAIPHVDAATFTLSSVIITDFDEIPPDPALGIAGDLALGIETDASGYLPYTTPNLSVGGIDVFPLFDIWTNESNITADDLITKPISVSFSFSMPVATGGPIFGTTVGSADDFFGSLINDQGNVSWDSSADFSFGNGGIFRVSLSPASFNDSASAGGFGVDLIPGQANGATIEATLEYVQAPNAVPVPPAIFLLGTGILGIVGIRKKYKK